MVQRPARQVQQLERLVEARGVGRAGRADRERALEVAGQQVAAHHAFAGAHPVLVALHGVDLAVVREHPVRVRERPARERVGGEPRVHEAQRGLEAVVLEVGVEGLELVGREHALVDDDPGRQRREVRVGVVLDVLAGQVDVAFELVARRGPFLATNTWRNAGITSRALAPGTSASIGTSRQPRTVKPSSTNTFSASTIVASTSSGGRNAIPVAYSPAGGRSKSTTAR